MTLLLKAQIRNSYDISQCYFGCKIHRLITKVDVKTATLDKQTVCQLLYEYLNLRVRKGFIGVFTRFLTFSKAGVSTLRPSMSCRATQQTPDIG